MASYKTRAPQKEWGAFDRGILERIKSALPVDELARHNGAHLNRLGVGRCPLHDDSSPSFKATRDRWVCYAGCGSGDALDLIGQLYECAGGFVERLRIGCDLAGIDYDAEQASFLGQAPKARAPREALPPLKVVAPRERAPQLYEWEERAARYEHDMGLMRHDAEQRATEDLKAVGRGVLLWMLSQLDGLDGEALRWLEQVRGIDPELGAHWGLMSCTAARWRELVDAAAARFGADAAQFAGVMRAADGEHHRAGDPFPRAARFIVLPYEDEAGGLDTIRVRNIAPDAQVKMLSLPSHPDVPGLTWQPDRPFLEGHALDAARRNGCPLYACEGELDAIAVWQAGRPALATYGASVWHPGWCAPWKGLDRVIVLMDRDARAGEQLASRIFNDAVHEQLQPEGAPNVLRFFRAPEGAGVKDANDLLRAGALGEFLHKCEADR